MLNYITWLEYYLDVKTVITSQNCMHAISVLLFFVHSISPLQNSNECTNSQAQLANTDWFFSCIAICVGTFLIRVYPMHFMLQYLQWTSYKHTKFLFSCTQEKKMRLGRWKNSSYASHLVKINLFSYYSNLKIETSFG